jgi:hypothetical protein
MRRATGDGWGYLSRYFRGIAAKRIRPVEIDPKTSHQHEFDGVQSFRAIFGAERLEIPASVTWLPDDEDAEERAEGRLTWYDARENIPGRSAEFRLYYPAAAESVVRRAAPGDLVLVAVTPGAQAHIFISPLGSTTEQQLMWLFGLPRDLDQALAIPVEGTIDRQVDAVSARLLDAMGVEPVEASPDHLPALIEQFGRAFPTTSAMSAYARATAPVISPLDDPDEAALTWFNHEELLFRTLEKDIVSGRLAQGFDDVDDFMAFSLSVHNRRKSRAGYALEHHLQAIFDANDVRYSRGAVTEHKSRPDFIFPGIDEYRDQSFAAEGLTMLGVKATCKDRWRQILAEADRIEQKHLATLEIGISQNQTAEMRATGVTLVLPAPLHASFTQSQHPELLTLREFIGIIVSRQC